MSKPKILVIDDEQIALRNLQHILNKEGYDITSTTKGEEALLFLDRAQDDGDYDIVLTDLRMPGIDGMEILQRTKKLFPDTEVIMITGYATVDSAIETMKAGAYHYVAKPYKLTEVRSVVKEALVKRSLKIENRQLKERLAQVQESNIITDDPGMRKLLRDAKEVSHSNCAVLITGESGTGKELLARYIHESSPRNNGPMVTLNCGAFSEELLTNELFGHEKGAYTGADRKKIGLVESAQGGTLFLDEITEMPLHMQVKLLRIIQEKEVLPLGALKTVKVDVRFMAATNRSIDKMVNEREFRQDLFFRINVVTFRLPPLAKRRKDIALLTKFFLNKYATLMNKENPDISAKAMRLLENYDFPGNVRELENIIERALVFSRENTIEGEHFPDLQVATLRPRQNELVTLEEQEKKYISWILEKTDGNKTQAAEILGIDRVSLWRKLKRQQGGYQLDA